MNYPTVANISGVRYPINTDFSVALRCMRIVNDPSICDEERALAVIYLLFGFIPDEHADIFLEKAMKFLSCGEEQEEKEKKPDMDLEADFGFISASFQSDYRIDLSSVKMHWWRFCELLRGLTDNSALSRVREIRNYDLSSIKDNKTRQKMAEAQAALALPERLTHDDVEALEEFEKLWNGE